MSSVTIRLTNTCIGGGHLQFVVTGDAIASIPIQTTHISESISEEDIIIFVKMIIRLAKIGRTLAQTRALLQTGITIVI